MGKDIVTIGTIDAVQIDGDDYVLYLCNFVKKLNYCHKVKCNKNMIDESILHHDMFNIVSITYKYHKGRIIKVIDISVIKI